MRRTKGAHGSPWRKKMTGAARTAVRTPFRFVSTVADAPATFNQPSQFTQPPHSSRLRFPSYIISLLLDRRSTSSRVSLFSSRHGLVPFRFLRASATGINAHVARKPIRFTIDIRSGDVAPRFITQFIPQFISPVNTDKADIARGPRSTW